jgi:CubicO group peptidase (beta-lactamase class C family)
MAKPAKYGPFHHRAQTDDDAHKIQRTGELWGWPRMGSSTPQPQAYYGPLPQGAIGIEFYTNAKPHGRTVPGHARWWPGDPGVVLVSDEYARIAVTVTRNTHPKA